MKTRKPANLPASVRARLQNLARTRKTEFQLVLSEFAIERLLYRLGVSRHADRFVLKGATLFKLWTNDRHRATWDVDFLGRGASGIADVVGVVRDVCSIAAEDGIEFDVDSIAGEAIRAAEEYGGVRVRLEARLAEAASRVPGIPATWQTPSCSSWGPFSPLPREAIPFIGDGRPEDHGSKRAPRDGSGLRYRVLLEIPPLVASLERRPASPAQDSPAEPCAEL